MPKPVGRRELIALLGSAAAWPQLAHAQQPSIPLIGFLSGRAAAPDAHLVVAFRQGLNEAGYIEGQNAAIEFRWANEHFEQLTAMASDLISKKVAVLFAGAVDVQIKALKATISSIPAVFATGGDLVESGIVASINRPGGTITGVTVMASELWPKQLELLRDLGRPPDTVALLVNPNNATAPASVRDVQAAARAIGQKVLIVNVSAESDLESAFATLVQRKAGALLVAVDALLTNQRKKIAALAAVHQIPGIYGRREFAEAGGMMSYGASATDQYHQCGFYIGRILKGAKPADLPVLQPTKFELVINLKTAKTLGIAVPPTLIARADEVIE